MQISLNDIGEGHTAERDWHVTQVYAEWNALCWLKSRATSNAESGIPHIYEHGLVSKVIMLASLHHAAGYNARLWNVKIVAMRGLHGPRGQSSAWLTTWLKTMCMACRSRLPQASAHG